MFSTQRMWPGGSSSGSGVAVAAGIVDIALGTDTAGSGRVPAAFGNIVGLKPSIGAISAGGMVPACQSLDTISVFARTVDDALAVQRVVEGYDSCDPWSRHAPSGYLRRGPLPGAVRIAVADIDALCDPEVARLYRRAAGLFATQTIDLTPFLNIARLLLRRPLGCRTHRRPARHRDHAPRDHASRHPHDRRRPA